LSGLKTLGEKNISHGDIKPGNILCGRDPASDMPLAVIADLGGAREFTGTKDSIPGGLTPVYTLENERAELNILSKDLTEENKVKMQDLMQKMDVFSMGSVLFEAFEPTRP